MKKNIQHEDFTEFKGIGHKEIILFSITSMSTDYTANMNFLISRMYKVAKPMILMLASIWIVLLRLKVVEKMPILSY